MRFSSYIFLILCFAALTGCKSKMDSHHLVDPIYIDLQQKLQAAEKELIEQEELVQQYVRDMEKAIPQTGTYATLQSARFKTEKSVDKVKQDITLFKIQMRTRKKEAKLEYERAFAADLPWPSPESKKSFETYKRLRDAPRDWAASQKLRVKK